MSDLFGLDIAGILSDAIGSAGGLAPATLVKVHLGSRVPGDLAGGTRADTLEYATTGTLSTRTEHDPQTLTRRERMVVTLLGAALTAAGVVPEAGDRVAIEGATYDVVAVDRDPAAATYECTVAGA